MFRLLIISLISIIPHLLCAQNASIDLKHVIIDLEATNTSTAISGSCELNFTILETGNIIELELVGELTVDKVAFNGIETTFNHQNDSLIIDIQELNSDLNRLIVYYHGEPNLSEQVSKGISNDFSGAWGNQITWTLSEPFHAKYWWPSKQDLNDKIDSTRIHITTKQNLKVGSNGLLVNSVKVGTDKVRYEWSTHHPMAYYLLAFTVGEYVEYNNYAYPSELKNDSILIQNYIYNNPETLEYYKTQLDEFPRMVELFSDLFGLYPFSDEKYGHVMAPFGGGMEHQTMSTMGVFTFGLNAHELGHQWFGDQVTCGSWQDIWINEGFARFCEYVAAEKILSINNYYALVEDDILSVTGTDTGSVYVPNELVSEENRIFNFRLTYAKGGLLVNMIRHIVNDDELFFNALRAYLAKYGNKTATGNDFKEILIRETSIDFTNFFEDWYYGEGHPIFDIGWFVDSNGMLNIKVSQTTTANINLFTTPLEFEATFEDGTKELFRINQDQNDQQFALDFAKQITDLSFDPKGWLIKKVNSFQRLDENGNLILEEVLNGLRFWPNPVQGILQLSEPINQIRIYNQSGKLTQQITSPTKQINVSELDSGVYVFTGFKDDKQVNFKFIKH